MLDQFIGAATAVGATIKRFTDYQDAGAYIRGFADQGIAASCLSPQTESLLEGLSLAPPALYAETRACISEAKAGIASTGSLVLDIADQTGRAATALAPVHLVILKVSTLLPDLYAAHELLAKALGNGNAYYTITTGPSRTADIERVLTIGVHGPKELHILIMENE